MIKRKKRSDILRIGTDCSGIEAPIQALKNLKIPFVHEFSSEIDPYAIKSIMANFNPRHGIFGDMTTRDNNKLPDIDLYVCGFPCQTFSSAGLRKGTEDRRGNIFFYCVDTIRVKKPKYFILENVKGLTTIENGYVFENLLDYMDKILCEYNVYWKILNTKDYGIPQNRERLFIVGIHSSLKKTFKWPEPQSIYKSLGKFIDYNDRRKDNIPPSKMQIFERIPKKSKFINIGFGNNSFVKSDKISPCITTNGLWCVPLSRNANTKEYLKLQGFPSNFKQVVSDTQFKKQIGNSISVCVLEKIFEQLILL